LPKRPIFSRQTPAIKPGASTTQKNKNGLLYLGNGQLINSDTNLIDDGCIAFCDTDFFWHLYFPYPCIYSIPKTKTNVMIQPVTDATTQSIAAKKQAPIAAGLQRYKTLHLWMILPMLFMQLGIFRDYWGDFTDNAWAVHVHYWTGTIWYLYLIIQPYYATSGQMARHRTYGIIGIFVAGAVCLTALGMMHRDLANAALVSANPQRFGPFQGWFFMGVAAVEIVMMTAFGYAVIKSIIHRRQLENHAWWLISTVFLIMMPALGRGIQNVYVGINRSAWPNINIMTPIYATQVIIIAMLLFAAYKFGKMKHPATYLALGVNLFIVFTEPLGRSEAVQTFLKTIIKG
jgi:hypothetical protein